MDGITLVPPARRRKAKRPRAPERGIQIAIKNHLQFYGIVCVHVPNAAKRSLIGGRLAKAEGLFPSFPDLILLREGGLVGFLEVKAADGRVSPAQIDCHAMLRRLGQPIAVVRSQDEALAAVRAWGWAK